jgi:O-antigen ligase
VGFVTEQHQLVHNVYLQLLAELGIIGLGLFLAVAAACLRACYVAARAFDRLGRRDIAVLARGVLVATVGALAASLTLSNLRDPRLWILLALGPALCGIAAAAQASGKAQALAARSR